MRRLCWVPGLVVLWCSLACGGLQASFDQAKQQAIDGAKEAVQREVAERVFESLIEGADIELGDDGSLESFKADGFDVGIGPDAKVPERLVLRPPDAATVVAAGNAESEDGQSVDFALAGIPADTDVDTALDGYAEQLESAGWVIQPMPEGEEAPPDGSPRVVHAEKGAEQAIAFIIEAGEIPGEVDAEAGSGKQIVLLQVRTPEAAEEPSEEAAPVE